MAGQLRDEAKDRYLNLPEAEAVAAIYPWAAARIMDELREDMAAFKVAFDRYFSEQSLYDQGLVDDTLADLRARGHLYDADGAVWFRSTTFGDDKDRPLVKSNGEKTYITPDLAYHRDKFLRGYDLLIDVWGADHHGYIPRLKAGLEALGLDPIRLEALLVQMVSLLRDGVPVSMSTRAGEYVTLREVLDEVGADAARFSYLLRRFDSKLDFDLEVAKRQSNENPVYYVQYAHARISSVFKKAAEEGLALTKIEEIPLDRLSEPEEGALIRHLASFPDVVEGAAVNLEPHRLTHYLMDLAGLFHPYYNRHRFIGENPGLSQARLFLAACVRQVVANGLGMLGVNAPETM
jgi:arginyl-tRNA synthetase